MVQNFRRKPTEVHVARSGVLVIGLFIIGQLLGCGKKDEQSAEKTTITFWHSFVSSTVPALNDLLKKFEQEYPGIEIKSQYVPTGDALLQKLITAIQSNTAPDISWIHSNFLQNLVEADAVYQMNEFIKGENGLSDDEINDIYPALLQAASWRGTLYSMPMEATNLGLVYNKQLFREVGLDPDRPPQTWEDLRSYAKELTLDRNSDGKFEHVGFFVPVYPASHPLSDWMVWQWYPFLWQAGGHEINPEQTALLVNGSEGVRALTFWKTIYDELNLRSFTPDYDAAFAGKQLAMALDGPWSLPRYQTLKNLDWAIAPLPSGPVKRATIVGGEYLAIFKQSQHSPKAWTFVKWILRPDIQAFWSIKSGYLPVRRSVISRQEYQAFLRDNPGLRTFVEQMEFGQSPRPIDYHGLEISRSIAEAIEKATLGRIDPQIALDEAAAKSNRLLRSVARR